MVSAFQAVQSSLEKNCHCRNGEEKNIMINNIIFRHRIGNRNIATTANRTYAVSLDTLRTQSHSEK